MTAQASPSSTAPHALSVRRGQGRLLCALVALALAVMVWSTYWLGRTFEARAQAQMQTQQALEADLWARLLTVRLEASQRLLAAIAQGVHTSLLDKPEILDALMRQEGSVLSLFESLHVGLPSGAVSQHSLSAQTTALGPDGLSALRRTIAEGKPTVTAMQHQREEPQYLHVLLTVPIRQADGKVSAALAAMVKYPLGLLLPDVLTQAGKQHLLLDRSGTVLVHADSAHRWRSVGESLPDQQMVQRLLEQPASHHAESVQGKALLLTRVGLPLPQWQVVLLSDTASAMPAWMLGLPWLSWVCLLGGTLGLALLTSWWCWRSQHAGRSVRHAKAGNVQPEDDLPTTEAALLPSTKKSALEQARSALGAMPSALLLHLQGKVVLMTSQAAVLLGYRKPEAESMLLQQLVARPETCGQVQRSLQELGRFEGAVEMRKKDGDVLHVQLSAWTTDEDASACVWQLHLPWRHRLELAMPETVHAARDSLTGLHGREAFLWGMQSWGVASMQALHAGNAQAQGQIPAQGCVLFADLDHLGMLNESTSRDMGNQVLAHVARLIASYLEPLGDVARLGGDEFVALLPGVSLAHAQCIGQALCDAVWQWQPSWHGERHWVSISVGVVAVDAQRHAPEDALRAADMACYEAKRRGRCQVAVWQIAAQPHATAADG